MCFFSYNKSSEAYGSLQFYYLFWGVNPQLFHSACHLLKSKLTKRGVTLSYNESTKNVILFSPDYSFKFNFADKNIIIAQSETSNYMHIYKRNKPFRVTSIRLFNLSRHL